jgi:hypothetical protein
MLEKKLKIVKLNKEFRGIPKDIPFVLENFEYKYGYYNNGIVSFPKNILEKSSIKEAEKCNYYNFISYFFNSKKLLYTFGNGIINIIDTVSYFIISPTANCQLGIISNFSNLIHSKKISEVENILGLLFNFRNLILIDIKEEDYEHISFLSEYIYKRFPYINTNGNEMNLILLEGNSLRMKHKTYNYLNFINIFNGNEKLKE